MYSVDYTNELDQFDDLDEALRHAKKVSKKDPYWVVVKDMDTNEQVASFKHGKKNPYPGKTALQPSPDKVAARFAAKKTPKDDEESAQVMSPWTGKDVAKEVMSTEVQGHKNIEKHIEEAMRAFVGLAQETNKKVRAAVKTVEGYSGGVPVDLNELEKLVLEAVIYNWGEDPGAKLFAKMFARGDYIY